MNAREARTEFQRQRLTVEQLFDLLEQQEQTIRRLQAEIDNLKQRLAQYEPEIQSEIKRDDAPSGAATRYSLEAEEKRRRRRKKKKSPGRRKTHLKFADAERSQDIYPDNARSADCELSRERAVWRLENGRAVLMGYRVFRAAGGVEPRIPGVTLRCEYGIEILVVLSFLVYIIGLSLEKACMVLRFFCRLPLSKSQADALLRQLARHWETEFDTLCELCNPYWSQKPEMKPHERDFANLVNELLERMMDEELFTFVLNPKVEATNNLTERLQRSPAEDRKAGRTSTTAAGAHRRSVIVSVLESLRANLAEFTLDSVLEEVRRWMQEGVSLFARQWQEAKRTRPELYVDPG